MTSRPWTRKTSARLTRPNGWWSRRRPSPPTSTWSCTACGCYEDELNDRATQDERRLQRIAAAEQLRAQIAAVTEALERSEDEYHTSLAAAEAGVTSAEASLERATAALSDAVRRLRRISEALPPALRPRAGDDPLGELPRLRETLAAEVDRAEVALAAGHQRPRARPERHRRDPGPAGRPPHRGPRGRRDRRRPAAGGAGPRGRREVAVVLDDPFGDAEGLRDELLDEVAAAAREAPRRAPHRRPRHPRLGHQPARRRRGRDPPGGADPRPFPTRPAGPCARRRAPTGRGRPKERSVLRRIPIRRKLAAALAIPIAALLVVAVPRGVAEHAATPMRSRNRPTWPRPRSARRASSAASRTSATTPAVWLLGQEENASSRSTSFDQAKRQHRRRHRRASVPTSRARAARSWRPTARRSRRSTG